MQKNISTTGTKGFTLVELLVAMSLFGLIMIIVGSAFVYGLDLQRRAFNLQQTEENAAFVLETMIKELRVSQVSPSVSDSDCTNLPELSLSVLHPDLGAITYTLSGTDIHRNGVAITSSTVAFTKLNFCISGSQPGDGRQTRITMLASMRSKKTKQQSLIDIQTSVSPRSIND
ncbi:MAG: prepilin-type N-terminal cleavage/methylation domain-containing protein [Patescibacteria group bacterium]